MNPKQQKAKHEQVFTIDLGFCVCIVSGLERYYRVHDGLHFAWQAYCKHLLQNIYLYKYVAGCKLFARFQTRALYEDPSPLYVHCPGLMKLLTISIFAFIVLDYICLKLDIIIIIIIIIIISPC